jgi:hypothetical protein
LENKGPLKVLNGTKLILDDHVNNLDHNKFIRAVCSYRPLFSGTFEAPGE